MHLAGKRRGLLLPPFCQLNPGASGWHPEQIDASIAIHQTHGRRLALPCTSRSADVTSPAATIALGLMYLQTNDAAVSAMFTLPGAHYERAVRHVCCAILFSRDLPRAQLHPRRPSSLPSLLQRRTLRWTLPGPNTCSCGCSCAPSSSGTRYSPGAPPDEPWTPLLSHD